MTDAERFAHLASQASDQPFFFGYALRRFATAKSWTDAELATWIGCTAEVLSRLRLCRVPTNVEQCDQIASRFGVPVERVREVAGL